MTYIDLYKIHPARQKNDARGVPHTSHMDARSDVWSCVHVWRVGSEDVLAVDNAQNPFLKKQKDSQVMSVSLKQL